jgi:hypothetical protein
MGEEFLRCSGTDIAQIQRQQADEGLLHRGRRRIEEDPMYPIALYGGLPEIAYLAPRGSFLAPRLADEEPPSRRTGERRSSPAPDAVTTDGHSQKA